MGEIKSTLDLVMEKTRNLRLTDDEKKSRQIDDLKKQFNGVVQKYLDNRIGTDAVKNEADQMKQNHPALDLNAPLCRVVLDRIDLQGLDGPLVALVQSAFGVDIAGFQRLEKNYRQQIDALAAQRKKQLASELLRNHGIGGSAVQPNLDADPLWREEKRELTEQFSEKLAVEKQAVRKMPPQC